MLSNSTNKEVVLKEHNNEEKFSFKKLLNNLKNQLIDIYTNKKIVIYKIIIFLGVAFFVLFTSFYTRSLILESQTVSKPFIPGFIKIVIVGNTGIAFGGFNNASSAVVYLLQIIPIFVAIGFLIFCTSRINDALLSFILFGGLSNLIDRAIVDEYTYLSRSNIQTINAVVDYLQFEFLNNSAIFNIPDIYVVGGFIGLILHVVIVSIINYIKDKNNTNSAEATN